MKHEISDLARGSGVDTGSTTLYIKTVQGDLGKKYHEFESACPITAQGVFTFEFGVRVAREAGCFEILPVTMTR